MRFQASCWRKLNQSSVYISFHRTVTYKNDDSKMQYIGRHRALLMTDECLERKSYIFLHLIMKYLNNLTTSHIVQTRLFTTSSVCLAKKDKSTKKENLKSRGKATVFLSPDDLNRAISFDNVKQQMVSTLEHLKKDYAEKLSLKTSISSIDRLVVETPDGKLPLIQLAQVVQKNPQLLMVNMASSSQYISHAKSALLAFGLNSYQEGTTIFVALPKVSREHREALAKTAKQLCDKTKEKLRDIQNNSAKELRKVSDSFSQDLIFNLNEALLHTTRDHIQKAEDIMTAKQKELLGN